MTGGEPELRLDTITGEWVTIAGRRQGRPNLPSDDCPFCLGGLEAPEPYAVHAFPNRWPVLTAGPPLDEASVDQLPARGAAEVVLYSPDHDASLATIGVPGARRVVDLWAERTAALLDRPEVAYVLVFENRGRDVGATIDHPHGQIYAFPFVPPIPAREAEMARRGCPVCAEARRELGDGRRVVLDRGGWLGWVPFASSWPYGVLLAPRDHLDGLPGLSGEARDGLARALVDLVGRYDRLFATPFPYMLWVHQQPGDADAHVHVHLAPPRRGAAAIRYVAAGELGSGTLFNPVPPEDAAAQLRAVGDDERRGSEAEA